MWICMKKNAIKYCNTDMFPNNNVIWNIPLSPNLRTNYPHSAAVAHWFLKKRCLCWQKNRHYTLSEWAPPIVSMPWLNFFHLALFVFPVSRDGFLSFSLLTRRVQQQVGKGWHCISVRPLRYWKSSQISSCWYCFVFFHPRACSPDTV